VKARRAGISRPQKNGELNRGGRPEFKVTPEARRTVEAMASFGIPEKSIASVVGCDEKTLRKYFPEEIAVSHIKANAKVAETLFNQAIKGNTTAIIFWLKCRAGWKEKHEVQHSGEVALGTTLGVERFQSELARIVTRAATDLDAEKAHSR
jgi:hypothetical protein